MSRMRGASFADAWLYRPARLQASRPALRLGLVGVESETGRVDAVALARGLGTVLKHVAEVRPAGAAMDLRAAHEEAVVGLRLDRLSRHRLEEARPSGARIELRLRAEELLTARNARVRAVGMMVPVAPREGPLRPLLAADGVLLGRQLRPPLGFGLLDLLRHALDLIRSRAQVKRRARCRRGRTEAGTGTRRRYGARLRECVRRCRARGARRRRSWGWG